MDLNVVVLAGLLASLPELLTLESGMRCAKMLVAVKTESPRKRLDVLPVVWWNPPEQWAPASFQKGQRVLVSGALQRRFWEASEGRRSRIEIIAETVSLGDSPQSVTAGAETAGD